VGKFINLNLCPVVFCAKAVDPIQRNIPNMVIFLIFMLFFI